MIAHCLDIHVMQGGCFLFTLTFFITFDRLRYVSGYEFLMKNCAPVSFLIVLDGAHGDGLDTEGDRICLFGFSRGAYTARALAGMLHKVRWKETLCDAVVLTNAGRRQVGLLPADNLQQVCFAYKLYTDTSDEGWQQSNRFKRSFSLDVDIHFVGVWYVISFVLEGIDLLMRGGIRDTVDSVGILPRRLPFTTSNTIVRTFRQALALDERRASFKANSWNYPSDHETKLGLPPPVNRTHQHDHDYLWMKRRGTTDSVVDVDWDGTDEIAAAEAMYASMRETETDVYEVWFSGCHSGEFLSFGLRGGPMLRMYHQMWAGGPCRVRRRIDFRGYRSGG